MGDGDQATHGPDARRDAETRLVTVRDELRFELGLLHDRVNALLAAEAFLTIAYTAAMSNGAAWGRPFATVAAPVLAVLGFLLAVLALPGVLATARIVLTLTALQQQLVGRLAGSAPRAHQSAGSQDRGLRDQRRSLLFFRTVPLLFAVVWMVLLTVTGVLLW